MVNYPSPEGSGFLPMTNERKIYEQKQKKNSVPYACSSFDCICNCASCL